MPGQSETFSPKSGIPPSYIARVLLQAVCHTINTTAVVIYQKKEASIAWPTGLEGRNTWQLLEFRGGYIDIPSVIPCTPWMRCSRLAETQSRPDARVRAAHLMHTRWSIIRLSWGHRQPVHSARHRSITQSSCKSDFVDEILYLTITTAEGKAYV